MTQPKTQVEKMNTLLELLAAVNHILDNPYTLADRLQQMQYERQKQQFLTQITELLGASRKSLVLLEKQTNETV